MKNLILTFFALISFLTAQSQETYLIGKTEYYYSQYYSTTGKPVVKRSEANKNLFLKSQGYKTIPYGYQIDHITPLCEGGSDDSSNMQLLTIEQHKVKTAKERTNRSSSNYLATKESYKKSLTTNEFGEQISYAVYSRTDYNGNLIYINENGKEYYFNENERKVYVQIFNGYKFSNKTTSESTTSKTNSTNYTNRTSTNIIPTNNSQSLPTIQSVPSAEYVPTSTSRDIQTGPRGGQYYINSNGNKTYVPR